MLLLDFRHATKKHHSHNANGDDFRHQRDIWFLNNSHVFSFSNCVSFHFSASTVFVDECHVTPKGINLYQRILSIGEKKLAFPCTFFCCCSTHLIYVIVVYFKSLQTPFNAFNKISNVQENECYLNARRCFESNKMFTIRCYHFLHT